MKVTLCLIYSQRQDDFAGSDLLLFFICYVYDSLINIKWSSNKKADNDDLLNVLEATKSYI